MDAQLSAYNFLANQMLATMARLVQHLATDAGITYGPVPRMSHDDGMFRYSIMGMDAYLTETANEGQITLRMVGEYELLLSGNIAQIEAIKAKMATAKAIYLQSRCEGR